MPPEGVDIPERDYSGTPLATKLGIRPGLVVVLAGDESGFAAVEACVPEGTSLVRAAARPPAHADVAVLFARDAAPLAGLFDALRAALPPDGSLWVAWPKKASKVPTDLTFDLVQGVGLSAGMVDNKSCAIDAIWQGVRFVYRRKDRPAVARGG